MNLTQITYVGGLFGDCYNGFDAGESRGLMIRQGEAVVISEKGAKFLMQEYPGQFQVTAEKRQKIPRGFTGARDKMLRKSNKIRES